MLKTLAKFIGFVVAIALVTIMLRVGIYFFSTDLYELLFHQSHGGQNQYIFSDVSLFGFMFAAAVGFLAGLGVSVSWIIFEWRSR